MKCVSVKSSLLKSLRDFMLWGLKCACVTKLITWIFTNRYFLFFLSRYCQLNTYTQRCVCICAYPFNLVPNYFAFYHWEKGALRCPAPSGWSTVDPHNVPCHRQPLPPTPAPWPPPDHSPVSLFSSNAAMDFLLPCACVHSLSLFSFSIFIHTTVALSFKLYSVLLKCNIYI